MITTYRAKHSREEGKIKQQQTYTHTLIGNGQKTESNGKKTFKIHTCLIIIIIVIVITIIIVHGIIKTIVISYILHINTCV